MQSFDGSDGTRLAYHRTGKGEPLVVLPGGPMLASAYLGDLGGLSARRSLVRLDLRGTGDSAVPTDPSTYRCDRQVTTSRRCDCTSDRSASTWPRTRRVRRWL